LFKYNFGLYFTFWDKIEKTERWKNWTKPVAYDLSFAKKLNNNKTKKT
jgi:hypothetical protein